MFPNAPISPWAQALVCRRWNGSTGGLLVLDAAGNHQPERTDHQWQRHGFRGAGLNGNARCNTSGVWNGSGCQRYVAINANDLGGSKGEGIAGTPVNINNNGTVTNGAGTATLAVSRHVARRAMPGGGNNQHNAGAAAAGNSRSRRQRGKHLEFWKRCKPWPPACHWGGFGGAHQPAAPRAG